MNGWLLSIVGVVALGVLLEILLGEGETSKYIKGVFAIAVVLVLVAPLPKFFNKEFDFENFFDEEIVGYAFFQYEFNERRNDEREERIHTELKENGIKANKVKVYYINNDYNSIDVVKVYLDENASEDEIKSIVKRRVKCDAEDIRIYYQ